MGINYRKNELEQKMLMNLHKKDWTHGLKLKDSNVHVNNNEETIKVYFVDGGRWEERLTATSTSRQAMLHLTDLYNKSVQEESTMTADQLRTRHVGKQDPKRHLEEKVDGAMADNLVQVLGTMTDSLAF